MKITIKQFKRITDEVVLENCSNVNYLVGKNGSGKTSVLNALTLLNDERLAQPFIQKEGVVKAETGGLECYIQCNDTLQNGERKTNGDLKIKCYAQKSGEFRELNADVSQIGLDYTLEQCSSEQKEQTFGLLNKAIDTIGMDAIEQVNLGDKWSPRIGFMQGGKQIELPLLAQGFKNLADIEYLLTVVAGDLQNKGYLETYNSFFVVLEEPENNLHPELQKRIPVIIESFLAALESDVRQKVHFFIATHSPFIVGAASEFGDQKIYLLNDGQLNAINPETNDVAPTISSEGYSGTKCSWIVGKMLGADVTDFGYPENYCILEEYSMQVILEHCREAGLLKNVQFVSASGESNVIKIEERMDNVEKLNTLVKCNPYYYGKYLVVIDSTKDFKDDKKEKFLKIKDKIQERFIELEQNGLEDYYQNLSPEIHKNCVLELDAEKDTYKKGVIKSKYAVQIAPLIKTSDDFRKLFNGELDVLLR